MSQSPHIDTDSLSAYLDDAVSVDERGQIAGHLADCAHCRRELAELRATVSLLHHLPHFRPRRSFRLGPEHRRGWSAPVTLLPAVRALAVAAVLLFVIVTGVAYVSDESADERLDEPAALMQQPTARDAEEDGTTGDGQTSLLAEATQSGGDAAGAAVEEMQEVEAPLDDQGAQDAQEAAAPDSADSADDAERAVAQDADIAPKGTVGAGEVTPAAEAGGTDDQPAATASEPDAWALASAGLGMLAAGLLVAWAALARLSARRRQV